jgi:enoyl-CoA hydratase/carnithine racemase
MTEQIIITDDGPIRTVRMNRPDKKNALTMAMYDAMTDALESASAPSIHCVIIVGAPGAFCAGNDLQDFIKAASGGAGPTRPAQRFLPALVRCEKPLIAAVTGVAVGIGTTMLMHCDHVVASTDARFSTPFVGLGLVPEAASSLIAPRFMGHSRAFSLLVMGRPMDAAEAKAAGLVNAVVSPDAVEAEANKAAREIAALPPGAVAASRQMMRGSPEQLIARLDEEAAIFETRLRSPEARAAFEAFFMRKR